MPHPKDRTVSPPSLEVATQVSSLGTMLLAHTRAGVACALLGDDELAVRTELSERFPAARFEPASSDALGLLGSLIERCEAPRSSFRPRLDLRGTSFQLRVWRALLQIPIGRTTTYSDLAASLGIPSSTRAVAHAIAQNPIAVIVPCHRVVGKSGELTGYRWGLERKAELLRREASTRPAHPASHRPHPEVLFLAS